MPDADGDGISDASDNCPAVANTNQANADSDALGDVCDACPNDSNNDLDGDGICGDVDACPNDPNNDLDGDGICGDVDACPNDPNNDLDGDGICGDVDACPNDPNNDLDGDGICGDVDNCPANANSGQADVDGDTVGDACDNCPAIPNPQQVATDPNSGCRLIDNNDGTVTDTDTGKMWERDTSSSHGWGNWCAAQTACNGAYYGYSDWHLPSVSEYQALTGGTSWPYGPQNWSLPDGHPFQGSQGWYWTSNNSTATCPGGGMAYIWARINSDIRLFLASEIYSIWCVRN